MTRVKSRVFGEDRMAYVLVAVGAVMLGLGLYAAVTGSRIVQVEAGWTSVIAGSMLIVGGVLTMALGLVLRALLQLKASLPMQAATSRATLPVETPPVEAPQFEAPPVEAPPFVADEPAATQESPAPEAPIAVEPAKRNLFPKLHPLRKPKVAAVEVPPPPVAETATSPSEPEPAPESQDAHADPQAATPDPIEARPADDYKLETPSTPAHDLPPVPPRAEPTPPAPPEVDWLDRAFAEIDEDLPVQDRTHKPVPEVRAVEDEFSEHAAARREPEDEPEPYNPEPAFAEAEPTHVSADALKTADTAPEIPAPTSAVIGRYEADGTSYVMYADGSIEAHSEAGSYRFASMAELKAFIET